LVSSDVPISGMRPGSSYSYSPLAASSRFIQIIGNNFFNRQHYDVKTDVNL
jgi:hypothetical protein